MSRHDNKCPTKGTVTASIRTRPYTTQDNVIIPTYQHFANIFMCIIQHIRSSIVLNQKSKQNSKIQISLKTKHITFKHICICTHIYVYVYRNMNITYWTTYTAQRFLKYKYMYKFYYNCVLLRFKYLR